MEINVWPKIGVPAFCFAFVGLALVMLMVCDRRASAAGSPALLSDAQQVFHDVIGHFWVGEGDGYPITSIKSGGSSAVTAAIANKGQFWQYGMLAHFIAGYWEVSKSPDAKERMLNLWNWMQLNWTAADFSSCGVGTTSVAQDDAAWGASALLDIYDVLGDRKALDFAKRILDCSWDRWHDDTLGGGLWYSDARTEKSSYQGPFALALNEYAVASGNSRYRDRAVELLQWAEARLRRSDGLYWEGIRPNGRPIGEERPAEIRETSSVTFLAGNMAFAVLESLLYRETHQEALHANFIKTAKAIGQLETTPDNVFLNDRDARTDGWSALSYATNVAPLLGHDRGGCRTIKSTAGSIINKARKSGGIYNADWSNSGDRKWAAKGFTGEELEVSANTGMWPIAAEAGSCN